MAGGKDPSISETGNWNVASRYSDEKIMNLLIKLDMYETASEFGVLGLEEESMTDPKQMKKTRIRSLKWFHHYLKLLINNTKFAIKNQIDKEKFEEYLKTINEVKPFLSKIENSSCNPRTKVKNFEINEKPFNLIFEALVKIKTNINEQLNKADLIFVSPEVFDIKKLKEQILQEVLDSG